MSGGTTHIIGAGLAGLSAAARLAEKGRNVVVHELARHPGGRCRSFYEPTLDLQIDNGNHLLLSGNRSALSFLDLIGARDLLQGPNEAEFAFADLQTDQRWTIRPNNGSFPWWIFSRRRRVPGTSALDYMCFGKLLAAGADEPAGKRFNPENAAYKKLMRPVLLAALNCDPEEGSSRLTAAVLLETLARGGQACKPLIAAHGLGPALVDPAVTYIEKHGGAVRFDVPLRALDISGDRIRALRFAEGRIDLAKSDTVILAVPAWVARTLIPGLKVPTEYRAIFNAHFKIAPPPSMPRITGVINGATEWLFAFDDRLSVTISNADRFNEAEREPLARQIWSEVAQVAGMPEMRATLPPWQIVKERRATFTATPAQNALRPDTATRWRNLFLAGDWTATNLPATIEGAIRSGEKAAKLATA
ncbi:hypothetical protein DLM45_04490 [Hyphomicrobium methylovorum]|uniref:hydroxysqualene dehydroxylase HpnE n=1 Tax=Hyphomicrobium methylovorum TaxID=84 RepID=UPI0015E6B0DB|nr:hydroxysqualene dehydroxylase HpnE [Hyphomicrobium methylovorum]MBA2125483.1 hypothetical protein [Hyphomicrobium methylovorum]